MFWEEAQGSLARPPDSPVPINQPTSLQLFWPYLGKKNTERERTETDGEGRRKRKSETGCRKDREGWKAIEKWRGRLEKARGEDR